MDIFSGLGNLGFGNVDIENIYAEQDKQNEEEKATSSASQVQVKEEDFIFDKSYACPVCDAKIKAKTVRTGKARVVATDSDLRPIVEGIEPLKYEVILCNRCGYAVTSKYMGPLASIQKKKVKEAVCANYKPMEESGSVYSYEEAITRYKLALLNSVVKMSKASEKAYTCLKAGWLARSYSESLEDNEENKAKISEIKALEAEFMKKAYEGFITALSQEKFPISGMDNNTLTLLLASLAKSYGTLEDSAKFVADLLLNPNCPERIKNKARLLKEELIQEKKK